MARIRKSPSADGQVNLLSSLMSNWLQMMQIEELFTTCLTCRHLTSKGQCGLVDDMPIPVHIAITGCDKYVEVDPTREPAAYVPRARPAADTDPFLSSRGPSRFKYDLDDDIPF